jgi:hypothetical protein
MIRARYVQLVSLLGLAGCSPTEDSSNPARQPEIVWDVDSDGRMEMLAQDGLWSFASEGNAGFVEVGDYSSLIALGGVRSRGPRLGGAGAVVLVRDFEGCIEGGVRALAADGTSECIPDEVFGPGPVIVLQQADGPECLMRGPHSVSKLEIGCTTSTLGWEGWVSLTKPSQLDGQRWAPCGGVVRPPGEVGALICTQDGLIGWASAAVDGGDLHYVEFSTSGGDSGPIHAEDPRFPNHFAVGAGNNVDQPPDFPTRFCEVSDWDAGEISCVAIDAKDAISSLQLMRLEPGQSTPAVFIRSEFGERQWLYWNGERREVTVAWPKREPPEDSPGGPAETLTVLDADGDGVDELAVRDWYEFEPVLLEFDGEAAFVPYTPP